MARGSKARLTVTMLSAAAAALGVAVAAPALAAEDLPVSGGEVVVAQVEHGGETAVQQDAVAQDDDVSDVDSATDLGSGGEADAADASVSETVEGDSKDWSVGVSTGISVGLGSFYPTDEGGTTRVSWNMGFSGSYTIPVIDVTVSAGTGFTQFLSRGGGSQEPQEFRWSDTDLTLSRSIYTIPVVDIGISGSLSYTIPTSRYSIATGSYGSLSPGLSFNWALGGLSLGYSIGYSYNFYEYTSTTFDPSEVDIIGRNGGTEMVASDAIAEPGVLTEHSLSNSFRVGYRFLEDFSVGMSFGFNDSWTFDNGTITQPDEYTSEYADSARGHSQGMSGALRFSYSPIRYLSMSLSLSSAQPWKTADNKGYRFPFFDTEGPQSNRTRLGFSISGSY